MGQRLKYQCWNCKKTYTLYKEIEKGTKVRVACPYCHKEGIVDLRKYEDQFISTQKGTSPESQEKTILNLPEIISTEEFQEDQE